MNINHQKNFMRRNRIYTLLMVVLSLCACSAPSKKDAGLHTINIKNMEQLQDYFTYRKNRPIIISGHRGGMMQGCPENCITSCERTLMQMQSFFEIDPRLTKDSVLVLMHDDTIDRTTNGTGKVSGYTYKELQQFNLKDREGNITPNKIPTLFEMLDWGKDKTIFNLDNKHVPWSVYLKMLKEHNWNNIILSVRSLEEALYYYERNDNVMLCVAIFNMDDYLKYKHSSIPWNRIMAYVGYSMQPEQKEVYNLLHNHGVMCMISIHPTSDRIRPNTARLEAYKNDLASRPDIIETDYPSLFVGLQK